MKKAIITGITGQDGAYLAELLIEKGYEVHGIRRRTSLFNTDRIDHLYQDPHLAGTRLFLHYGDLTDTSCLVRIIQQVQPDEIYNLAAQSHVAVSFEEPEYTANSDALGALRILEAIRLLGLEKKTKFYQASTSELYGLVQEIPQKETTPFYPRSPYAVAKLYAYWITVNYREAYGMYACNGILFNHESPLRGETFVTRKITRALARIKLGLQECLYLGNLNAKRDWGHAKDYVEMQWMMLQQDKPEDFVIATGVQYSVRDFINAAAKELGMSIQWDGDDVNEKGYDADGKCIVAVDPRYFRPTEVETLLGDPSKAKEKLGWTPKITFDELVAEMVREDLKSAERDELVKRHGYKSMDYHEYKRSSQHLILEEAISMKAVLLAGGLGTRISEETALKPKPMIEIGGKPILWHIMKMYSAHGIHDFIICCGYKGYVIKEYFANYFLHMSDVTFDMQNNKMEVHQRFAEPWRVTLIDTGTETMTGGRLKQVAPYLENEEAFCMTYGDGVSDVNLTELIAFHKSHNLQATLTATYPPGRFGALDIHSDQKVTSFKEKPKGDGGMINGGFFVLSPKVIDLIDNDKTIWEQKPLERLAEAGQLKAYPHEGFWQCMDTLRDKTYLEELWASGKAPWKVWS